MVQADAVWDVLAKHDKRSVLLGVPLTYPPRPVHGWRSGAGESIPQPVTTDDGVWPQEFQNFEWYTRAGSIENVYVVWAESIGEMNSSATIGNRTDFIRISFGKVMEGYALLE